MNDLCKCLRHEQDQPLPKHKLPQCSQLRWASLSIPLLRAASHLLPYHGHFRWGSQCITLQQAAHHLLTHRSLLK
jgi:hypothetical protein